MHTPHLKRATCRLNEETKGPSNRENASNHEHPAVVYHGYMPQNTTLGRVPGCDVTSYPSLCPLWKVKTMDTRLVCQLRKLFYVQVSAKTAQSVCGCKCTTFFPHITSAFYQYQREDISSFPKYLLSIKSKAHTFSDTWQETHSEIVSRHSVQKMVNKLAFISNEIR